MTAKIPYRPQTNMRMCIPFKNRSHSIILWWHMADRSTLLSLVELLSGMVYLYDVLRVSDGLYSKFFDDLDREVQFYIIESLWQTL